MAIGNPNIAGVILAGGQSRRMGVEKSFVCLAGRPLIAHLIERVRPQIGPLVISANGDAARFDAFGLPIIADRGGVGPLAGILAAMLWARGTPGVQSIVTAPVDTPFLPYDLVAKLSAARDEHDAIAIATSSGRDHPVVGLFPLTLAADLASYLAGSKERSAKGWIGRHHITRLDFEAGPDGVDPFFNVNSPAELAEAERSYGAAALHRARKR